MGLKSSPDIAQPIIKNVLANIDDVDEYIDDVDEFFPDWDHHIKLLGTILHCLWEIGFTIKPVKSE